MERQSCLNDPSVSVVADTSVVINLNASGSAQGILEALPNPFLVVSQVQLELSSDRRTGRSDSFALGELVDSGRVAIVQLGNDGVQYFSSLVSGSAAQTLDDGEAATIAYAMEHNAITLVDERKAHRICAESFPELLRGSTVDILAQEDVVAALGRRELANAVFNALRHGRMRVQSHHLRWVVDLIGLKRARQCISLPRSARNG